MESGQSGATVLIIIQTKMSFSIARHRHYYYHHPLFSSVSFCLFKGDPGDNVIPSNDAVIELPQNNDIIFLANGTAIDARHNQVQTEEQVRESIKRRDEVRKNFVNFQ